MKLRALHVLDFYKANHISFYDKNLEYVYNNFTPRSTKHMEKIEGIDDKITLFGLQYYIKYFLMDAFNDTFFNQPKEKVVGAYKRRMDTSLGKDAAPVYHLNGLHDLGYLPLSIKALPEGTRVNARVPFFTMINTHPKFGWLPGFLEDSLSCLIWRASTSATIATKYRILAEQAAIRTADDSNLVKFLTHDFQLRGCGGIQDAALSGAGFLINFLGTDNVPAIDLLEDYYNANAENELIGTSINANEHSTVCIGGEEKEFENYKRWITNTFPDENMISLVSDTWDLWRVLTDYFPRLKNEIMARKGKIVVRPDSSPKTPLEIICGDPEAKAESPEHKGVVELLWDLFGGSINKKGFKVLHPCCGMIYGESISLLLADKIFKRLEEKGFCSTNIAKGVGSYSFIMRTRDSLAWACKATAGVVGGEFREIWKDPITDSGMKKSAKGFLRVDLKDGVYTLKDQCTPEEEAGGELKEVFRDGKLLIDHTLFEIRKRVEESL